MIKEREKKIFTYDVHGEMDDADFLLTDFCYGKYANPHFNSRFIENCTQYLTTSYDEEKHKIVIEAFCRILSKKDAQWKIDAIQPIPGVLKIRLEHQLASTLDAVGEEECVESMDAKEFMEAKRALELFGGYTAELTYEPSAQRESWGDFVLDYDDNSFVLFQVEFNKTFIKAEGRSCYYGADCKGRKYTLTWKSKKHKKFIADIIAELSLD